ncbi:hypothetical protein G7077_04330 [Sphingomonas piscis]|uniref:Uncharacterized protein n=1 Tax=Sphingomonas piscis TaxID=2714943 RepID=A0A6G7YND0_9SPHN|nr:hypothetical protein [Sphingomonas piscis]QIK78244.1 hypothetical protein G7077_04330 [Sphingomonas piscis]
MASLIAMWAIVALALGHADAARMLAATVLMRATLMLTQMTTAGPLRRRRDAPPAVRKASVTTARLIQLGVLGAMIALTGLWCFALEAAGQPLIARLLPLVSLSLTGRVYRALEPGLAGRNFPLVNGLAGLAAASVVWALNGGAEWFALAYGLREWAAILLMRRGRLETDAPDVPTDEPLLFAEVAQNTVITSRRMLTYRLTKNLLAVFGPFGNFAARTGRGLQLHSRLEPYMPHRLGGFAAFAATAIAVATFLTVHSGKPVALIAGAGAMQMAALALNVMLWWRYLPRRDDPSLIVEEDDDDS